MLFTFMSNTYFFFDIVNIAMYTLLIRYRFYNVNIAEYFFAVNIVDIVDIATSTMLNRYRIYIVNIVDISLAFTSSTLSTSQRAMVR